jgi:hypothetical protein
VGEDRYEVFRDVLVELGAAAEASPEGGEARGGAAGA